MSKDILFPEQVVPFLQHDDRIVREHAARYFNECHQVGPLTADDYWAVIDRLGEVEDALGFATALHNLPQSDASLRRLLGALASHPPEIFEFHYQYAARNMDLAVLARNREQFLSCPQLLPHVREHLELRLRLLEQSPAEAWERLMQHGRELGQAYAMSFNYSQSDALVEASARGGEAICRQAMNTLEDESAIYDWREIFAVRVLGLARYEPAIDALIDKLNIDADLLRDEVNRSLSRIGSPKVVQSLVSFYPGKPWHVRLYAPSSISNIKRPESASALLEFLKIEAAIQAGGEEDHSPLADSLLIDMTYLGSLAALEESRRWIAENPDSLEMPDLCEGLLGAAFMHGVSLPEAADWRRTVEKEHDRLAKSGSDIDGMGAAIRKSWRETGILFPSDAQDDDFDSSEDDVAYDEPWTRSNVKPETLEYEDDRLEPIRNASPKVGRNDPCPCGSGKKYKKCCGK